MKKFRVWWMANILNYPFWRVSYRDGKLSRLLYYKEAKGLTDVFNGILWIDYDYGIGWITKNK